MILASWELALIRFILSFTKNKCDIWGAFLIMTALWMDLCTTIHEIILEKAFAHNRKRHGDMRSPYLKLHGGDVEPFTLTLITKKYTWVYPINLTLHKAHSLISSTKNPIPSYCKPYSCRVWLHSCLVSRLSSFSYYWKSQRLSKHCM